MIIREKGFLENNSSITINPGAKFTNLTQSVIAIEYTHVSIEI